MHTCYMRQIICRRGHVIGAARMRTATVQYGDCEGQGALSDGGWRSGVCGGEGADHHHS